MICGAVDPVTGARCFVQSASDHLHTTEGDGDKSFIFKWADVPKRNEGGKR